MDPGVMPSQEVAFITSLTVMLVTTVPGRYPTVVVCMAVLFGLLPFAEVVIFLVKEQICVVTTVRGIVADVILCLAH